MKTIVLSLLLPITVIQGGWLGPSSNISDQEPGSFGSRWEKPKENEQSQSKKFKYKSPSSQRYSSPFTSIKSKSKILGKSLSKIRSDNKKIINGSIGRTHRSENESHVLKKAPRGIQGISSDLGILFVSSTPLNAYTEKINKLHSKLNPWPTNFNSLPSSQQSVFWNASEEFNKKIMNARKAFYQDFLKEARKRKYYIVMQAEHTLNANPQDNVNGWGMDEEYDTPYYTGCGDRNDDIFKQTFESLDIDSYFRDIKQELQAMGKNK